MPDLVMREYLWLWLGEEAVTCGRRWSEEFDGAIGSGSERWWGTECISKQRQWVLEYPHS
jgi:hypothetical protein